MKVYIKNIIVFLLISFTLSNCTSKKQENKEEEEHHEEVNPDVVSISEKQFRTVNIQIGKFENRSLSSMVKATGVLDLPPQNKATISTLVGGRITKINVIQGDFVNKGQTLALVENADVIKIQQEYLEARSRFKYSEKEYLRQKELYQEKIVAGKKFQAAEADYESQNALVSSLEGQLIQMGISPSRISNGSVVRSIALKTPIHGWVHKINVNTGSYVDPANDIFEVVDNHHVHIDLNVYETDVPKVKEGQNVYFTLTNMPNERFVAKIFSVGKAFDAETRSVSIHAEIVDNKNKNLLPGMYVDGRIEVDSAKVRALPEEAITTEGNLKYIFVKINAAPNAESKSEEEHSHKEEEHHEEENHEEKAGHSELTFRKVQIKTGASDQGYTEVNPIEEIPADAQIVTKGAYYLAAQMKKGEGGDDHGH